MSMAIEAMTARSKVARVPEAALRSGDAGLGVLRAAFPILCVALSLVRCQATGDDVEEDTSRVRMDLAPDECMPSSVETSTYRIDVISTIPQFLGVPAQIEVRRARPIFDTNECSDSAKVAVLQQGRTIDAMTAFDPDYQDYSLMASMAAAGIDTFTYNPLGYGHSSRLGSDDPCNASNASDLNSNAAQPINQQNLLIPNPLAAQCEHSVPTYFQDTASAVDQLDAVIEHASAAGCEKGVQNSAPRRKVNLLSWSLGGTTIGPYLARPDAGDRVESAIFVSSGFGPSPTLPLEEVPPELRPTWPMGVSDMTALTGPSLFQISAECPGQRDPAMLQVLWDSIRANDPLAASWGSTDPTTGGLFRWPTTIRTAFNTTQAAAIQIPVLVLDGILDTIGKPVELHAALGSTQKVRVRVDCGSHAVFWEGSTDPSGWPGPHVTARDAVIEWFTKQTFHGATTGTFRSQVDGTVVPE
jgi:pimeloyl-ACP methyl ester carboxylesterase